MSAGRFRLENEDDIDRIRDLPTAIQVIKEHRIEVPDKRNATLSDLKQLIVHYLRKHPRDVNKHNRKMEQNIIVDALKEDQANRTILRGLYEKSDKYLKNLPRRFHDDLERVFPNFLQTLKLKAEQLKKSDCAIIIAGDTGSGKSTLLNLLVGQQILPTHSLSCTATLCELRVSQTRSVILHYKSGKQSRRLECTNMNALPEFVDAIAGYIRDRDPETEESPYTKIEINWPFPMMEAGVVFVDTPGIGGTTGFDMEQYMDKALGFIYVINTGDAGGIHRDRLGRLLRQAVQQTDFDPETAIFVCNKWDEVDSDEEERVRRQTKEILRRTIPTINDRQIFKISATRALGVLEYQKMTADHVHLVDGIKRVLPITFHSKLLAYYRWMSSILKRTLFSLKMSKSMDARGVEENEALYKNVCSRIQQLETRAQLRVRDMRDDVSTAVEEISSQAIRLLANKFQRGELQYWKPDLAPPPDSWKKVVAMATIAISGRIQDIIDSWDREHNVAERVKSDVLRNFQRDVDLFEDQVLEIEGVFLGEDSKAVVDLHSSFKVRTPVSNVWKKAKKSDQKEDGFMSLGGAVASAFALDTRSNAVRGLFKTYSAKSAGQIMQEATKMYLAGLSNKTMVSAVEKFFERFSKNIDLVGKMLPEFLRADRQLMKSLTVQVKDKESALIHVYPKCITEGTILQGTIDMFFAKILMKFDFNFEDLNLAADERAVGEGSFARVFPSKVNTAYGPIEVALKVCKDVLKVDNVTDVLLEDSIMRDLDHNNVVRYYGASREFVGRDIKWIMVLEYCPKTLSQKMIKHKGGCPANCETGINALKVQSMKMVAGVAEQICCGLEYLHSKGLVHRDMKPDNILLDAKDVVKLTDVGFAKQSMDITDTVAGSPVYMAPEVLLQKGRYDFKADVYSIGIIQWEMWFGIDAADHIKGRIFSDFHTALDKGIRPSMECPGMKPPSDWVGIITKCWSTDQHKRPTAGEVRQFYINFLQKTQ